MKRLSHILYIVSLLLIVISFLASCTDTLQEDGTVAKQGNTRNMALYLDAEPVETIALGSRATSGGEETEETDEGDAAISDLWLVEYDEAGTQIGAARYMTWSEYKAERYLPIIVPAEDGVEYTCVIVANTHDDEADYIKAYSTLQMLQKNILSQSDILGEGNTESQRLLMNGFFKVTSQTTSASCKLYRNVAKLHLTLNNGSASGVKLKTIQLKNVPATIYYADQAMAVSKADMTATSFPLADETEFLEMQIDSLGTDGEGIVPGSDAVSLTYYLPRNMRGQTATTDMLARNNDVPDYATYVEVMASKVDGQGNELSPVRYRFYVGGNTTCDFNVRANYLYDIPLNFTAIGNQQTDSRVEDMSLCRLPADANSFIIHPLDGEAQQVYELPIGRVNEFWNHTRYSEQLPDFDGQIYSSTQWEVSVLWQTQNTQMLQFCDEDGNVTESTQGIYSSRGLSKNIFFKPVRGAKGNVLLGIRKKGLDECLWSWHLWLTDYNPDAATEKVNKYQKNVPGGRILRMEDGENYTIWADNPNMYMMDRNLGATAELIPSGTSVHTTAQLNTFGLYYQWGRKDPIPCAYNTPLYGMSADGTIAELEKKGNTTGSVYNRYLPIVKEQVLIAETVQHPMAIYANSSGWKDSPLNYLESWPEILSPAPSGWKLPELYTMQFLTKQATLLDADQYGKDMGYHAFVDKDSTITTFFPATGFYNVTTAQHYNVTNTNETHLWSSSSNGYQNGYVALNIYRNRSIYINSCWIAFGFNIRCVRK